jgi:hypothetical protein
VLETRSGFTAVTVITSTRPAEVQFSDFIDRLFGVGEMMAAVNLRASWVLASVTLCSH